MPDTCNKPLAAHGLTSYRYRGSYGWVMIGARDDAEALREAARSVSNHAPVMERLQIWTGTAYAPIA
jgi:hypothetical protein